MSTSRTKLKAQRESAGLCVYCGKTSPENGKKGCSICLADKVQKNNKSVKNNGERTKAYRQKLKLDVLEKYGNKCNCCGENNPFFLSIDHVNNDGNQERRSLYGDRAGQSASWYLKLRREDVRDDLQVLCFNCNISKAFYGCCPHDPAFKPCDLTILEQDNRRKGNFGLCTKIDWPSDEELLEMLSATNCTETAKKLGVTYCAVKGRLKRRGLWKKW